MAQVNEGHNKLRPLEVSSGDLQPVLHGEKSRSRLYRVMHGFTLIGRAARSNDAVEGVYRLVGGGGRFSTHNPLKCQWASDLLKSLKREKNNDSKRAAPLLAYVISITQGIAWIKEELQSNATLLIADHAKKCQVIVRVAAKVMALVLEVSRVSRGNEVCCTSFADLTVSVQGIGKPVWLLARAMVPKGSVPRPEWYREWKWNGKDKQEFLDLIHDCLPYDASALSLPDILEWCMRIILALEPSYCNPEVNPQLLMFLGFGKAKPHSLTPLTTNLLNGWLKDAKTLPPRAVGDRWLTSYSSRTSFAKSVMEFALLDRLDPELADAVRGCFGHSTTSQEIKKYAQTKGRVCVHAEAKG